MIQLPPEDPDELLERLNRETRRLHPPPGFDPLTASQAERDQFGLPPKPDPEHEPELYEFRVELFSSPLSFEEGDFSFVGPQPHNFHRAGAAGVRSRHESSRNWSGTYITPRDGRMFTDVLGRGAFRLWLRRLVSLLAPSTAARPGSGSMVSGAISIQPSRRSARGSSSMPSVFHQARPGSVGFSGGRCPHSPYSPPPVAPGDRIMCWLLVLNRTDVLFIIKNHTQGPLHMFIMTAPRVIMPPWILVPVQAEVSGATAEWVMERPTSLVTNRSTRCPTTARLPNSANATPYRRALQGRPVG